MNLQKVTARRAMLLQRIAQQRAELGLQVQSLQGPASFLDKGYTIAQKVRQHPKLVLAAAVLSLIVFRKSISIAKMSATALTVVRWGLSLNKWVPASFRSGDKPQP